MLNYLLTAMGLVFILEGLMPFLTPRLWRRVMHQMMTQADRTLRIVGLVSMLIGLGLLYLLR